MPDSNQIARLAALSALLSPATPMPDSNQIARLAVRLSVGLALSLSAGAVWPQEMTINRKRAQDSRASQQGRMNGGRLS